MNEDGWSEESGPRDRQQNSCFRLEYIVQTKRHTSPEEGRPFRNRFFPMQQTRSSLLLTHHTRDIPARIVDCVVNSTLNWPVKFFINSIKLSMSRRKQISLRWLGSSGDCQSAVVLPPPRGRFSDYRRTYESADSRGLAA